MPNATPKPAISKVKPVIPSGATGAPYPYNPKDSSVMRAVKRAANRLAEENAMLNAQLAEARTSSQSHWEERQSAQADRDRMANHLDVANRTISEQNAEISSLKEQVQELERQRREVQMDFDVLRGEFASLKVSKENIENAYRAALNEKAKATQESLEAKREILSLRRDLKASYDSNKTATIELNTTEHLFRMLVETQARTTHSIGAESGNTLRGFAEPILGFNLAAKE